MVQRMASSMRPSGVVVEAVEHIERAQVLLHLLDPAGPHDHGRHVGVAHAPGDRELGEGAVEVVGHGCQPADLGVGLGSGEQLAQPLVAGQRRPAALGHAVEVLAGQQAGGQRAPGGEAEADVLVEAAVLALDLAAVEQVVLGLLDDRLVQVVPVGDRPTRPGSRRPTTRTCPSSAPGPTTRCRTSPTPSPRSGSRGRGGGSRRGRGGRGRTARATGRWPRAGTSG